MGALVGLFKVLPIVLPTALEIIKLVEKIFGDDAGEEKRAIVVQVVRAAIVAAEDIKGSDIVDEGAFSEGIGSVVDGLVKILNATGVFKKDNLD